MAKKINLLAELKQEFAALQQLQKENKNILNYLSSELKVAIKEAKTVLNNSQTFKVADKDADNLNNSQITAIYDDAIVATDDVAVSFLQQEDVSGDELKVLTGQTRARMCSIATENVKWKSSETLALSADRKGNNIGNNIQNFMAGYAFGHKYKKIVVAAVDKIYICEYNSIGRPAKVIKTVEYSKEEKANIKFNLLQNMAGEDILLETPVLPENVSAEELIDTWSDLANMEYEDAIYEALKDNGSTAFIQDINDAAGKDVNLDYFSVQIDRLPNGMNQTELFNFFRQNINRFIDTATSNFEPFDPQRWLSDNFEGEIVHIDMNNSLEILRMKATYNPDDGSVIVTKQEENRWIFTTIFIAGDSFHPVSGNREFGININSDGSFTFYTAGVDRTTTIIDAEANHWLNAVFGGADALWNSLVDRMDNFINFSEGGESSRNQPITARPDWNNAKSILK